MVKTKKITKTAILKELHTRNTWNRCHKCFGIIVAGVMWQKNVWKLVSSENFDDISDRDVKTYVIKEFYEQKELCEYLYNMLNI